MTATRFNQHIRTSSKSRKGFRTYQKSQGISEQLDETLSSYGAYSTTAYSSSRKIEQYPKLFLFYKLPGGEKVICLSEYVGNDLHSYPPRAGNYIAHSLVCQNCEPFNIVQAYLDLSESGLKKLNNTETSYLDVKAGHWKTINQIIEEDAGADASMEINPQNLENLNTVDWYSQPFQALFEGDNGIRRNMFLQAVNAILSRKKVIIIDESDKLIHWTFALLQAFPPDFVFQQLNIASFANSNVLMDLCNVLCFELELEDRVQRYESEDRILINYNASPKPFAHDETSKYAHALFNAGMARKLSEFRNQIDSEFKSLNESYSLSNFNTNAYYFDGLFRIGSMTELEFRLYYTKCVTVQERKAEIFKQIEDNGYWDKCPIIWEALSPVNSLAEMVDLYNYANKHDTENRDWMDFEKKVIPFLICDVEGLDGYWPLINIRHQDRVNTILSKALSVVQEGSSFETRKYFVNKFQKFIPSSNLENKDRFERIKCQVERAEMVRKSSKMSALIYISDVKDKLDYLEIKELQKEIEPMNWEDFFQIKKSNEKFSKALISLYADERLQANLLPNKQIALAILNKDYDKDPDGFYRLYQLIHNQDQSAIYKYAPKEIKKIIDKQKPTNTIEDLESNLKMSDGKKDDFNILNKFIDSVAYNKTTYILWELAELIESKNETYPEILSVDKGCYVLLYQSLSNINLEIPEKFINLATDLINRGVIKRPIPNKGTVFVNDELKKINRTSEFKKLENILNKDRVFRENLESLVKLPWDCHTWESLYDHLNYTQKECLPIAIGYQLEWSKHKKESRLPCEIWYILACEYIIFLLNTNKVSEFLKCAKKDIIIDWDEYEYIYNRLLCFPINKNECTMIFKSPSNLNNIFKGTGPIWKHERNP